MADKNSETAARADCHKALVQLGSIDVEALLRPDLGAGLDFKEARSSFERVLLLQNELLGCDLQSVPTQDIIGIRDRAMDLNSTLQQILNFDPQQHKNNPYEVKAALLTNIQNRYHNDYVQSAPHIAFAKRRGSAEKDFEERSNALLAVQQQRDEKSQVDSERIMREMETALAQVKSEAAKGGVIQHARHFKAEADYHKSMSLRWLWAAIFFAIATVCYAQFSPSANLLAVPATAALATYIPKLIVLVILTFSLVWCARNYSASRHNFVVNQHRQNALSSFETFVAGAGDQQTKDAVLIQATQSIFAPQDSGFVKGENVPQPGGQVIEILRAATGK